MKGNTMVRVDTLLLAKYGIFQPVRREGPLAMTILHPLDSLTREDRTDLMEFAQACVAEHGLGDFGPRFNFDMQTAAPVDGDEEADGYDEWDEGVIQDEA